MALSTLDRAARLSRPFRILVCHRHWWITYILSDKTKVYLNNGVVPWMFVFPDGTKEVAKDPMWRDDVTGRIAEVKMVIKKMLHSSDCGQLQMTAEEETEWVTVRGELPDELPSPTMSNTLKE